MTARLFLTFASLFLACEIAHAQFYVGPAASGAGGGGRGAIDAGESSFLNPAGIAFIQRYHVTAFAGSGRHTNEGEFTTLALSLADGSNDAAIPGALTAVRHRVDYANGVSDTQTDIQLSLAGYPHKQVAFGLAGHRFANQILSPVYGAEYTQYNMHVGVLYVPRPNIGIGVVAYDVLPGDGSTPKAYRLVPTHAIGANYLYEKFFRLRFDLVRPDTKNDGRRMNVQAGIETFMLEMFAFRFGSYWRETADQTYLTAGFGYKGPRLSVDYAIQKDQRDGNNIRHLIDLWMPL